MEKSKLFFLFLAIYVETTSAKIIILPEEGIENCAESEEVDARYFNISEVEILVESDVDVFLNGTVTIMRDLHSPWVVEYFAEQFYRGQWNQSPIRRKFDDFCPFFHNPTDVWYKLLKDFPGCDFKAGVKKNFETYF